MFTKIKSRFQKAFSKTTLVGKIRSLFRKPLSEETIEELEKILYESDLGSELTMAFISRIEKKLKGKKEESSEVILSEMKGLAKEILEKAPAIAGKQDTSPHVILMVGTNGSGKTTSCAKLALRFKREGKSVLLAAADTFRAAAIEQLTLWANQLDLPIVNGIAGGDPSAVVYDALEAAKARNIDVVIIDTAGRLESKTGLMQQLAKLKRVSDKLVPGAPHETLLVLDATTGQHAIDQTKIFNEFTPLSGIVLSKIDGTAKGGIILSIYQQMGVPVRYMGLGEKAEDFDTFDSDAYIEALFSP